MVACRRFIASDDNIDVERVELDPATDAASGLGSDQSRPGAEEGINHVLTPIGDVKQRVLRQGGRLDCRVILEASPGVGAKQRGSGTGNSVLTWIASRPPLSPRIDHSAQLGSRVRRLSDPPQRG